MDARQQELLMLQSIVGRESKMQEILESGRSSDLAVQGLYTANTAGHRQGAQPNKWRYSTLNEDSSEQSPLKELAKIS